MATRIERSFRGITTRLAAQYLENLGGRRVDEDAVEGGGWQATLSADTVEGGGWQATLSADTVEIGPTLTLTEVTVVFEGEPEALESLVEDFARKAMRAGG